MGAVFLPVLADDVPRGSQAREGGYKQDQIVLVESKFVRRLYHHLRLLKSPKLRVCIHDSSFHVVKMLQQREVLEMMIVNM